MPGVGNHRLRVKDVAADALGNRHGEVGVESDPSDAHTSVVFVGGREERRIVVVMVAMAMAVAVVASLINHEGYRCVL